MSKFNSFFKIFAVTAILLFFIYGALSVWVFPNYLAIKEPKEMRLCIQPLGAVPDKFIQMAKDTLEGYYGLKITVLPSIPMPKKAFYPKTGRYRADTLLDYLVEIKPEKFDRILGLTEYSISHTGRGYEDWGILGLGMKPGASCIVSNFIMKANSAKLNHRWRTVILHEMGHTFGLDHCETKTPCLMKSANGTVLTIDKLPATLCSSCQKKLKEQSLTRFF